MGLHSVAKKKRGWAQCRFGHQGQYSRMQYRFGIRDGTEELKFGIQLYWKH
jgi:hypothetical protein